IAILFCFQAEDGIRDGHVTGVQTCALPISQREHACSDDTKTVNRSHGAQPPQDGSMVAESRWPCVLGRDRWPPIRPGTSKNRPRSEERRVGKECSWRCE